MRTVLGHLVEVANRREHGSGRRRRDISVKRTSLVGIAAAIVYIGGHILLAPIPGGGDTTAEDFQKFYVTDDNTGVAIAGVLVLTIGCLGMLWFFHEVREHIETPLARAGFVSTAVGLALVVAGAAIVAGPSGVQFNSDEPFVGNAVAHALAQAGYGVMLIGGAMFLGLGVGMLAVAGRRTGVLVPWVGIAGIVAAVLQVVGYIWLPMFAIPLWVLIVAITGLRSVGGSASPVGSRSPSSEVS